MACPADGPIVISELRPTYSACLIPVAVTPGGSLTIDGAVFDVEPFYIAKHQTTNAQFDAFLQAADGFDNPKWCVDMPAQWIPPQRSMRSQSNDLPDVPRERVSWYQAVAFTRWLNARMSAKNADISAGGLIVNGVRWKIRLPTEWEWQWAAQGGAEEREYPWGAWQEGHANTSEAGVGATTDVGSYPEGAAVSGALDMSGNVWEWCLSKRDAPYDVEVDAAEEPGVLRGGAFYYDRRHATSSVRLGPFPHYADISSGFRVGAFPLYNSVR